MSQIFHNLNVELDEDLRHRIELLSPGFTSFRILRESVDARRRHQVHLVYSVEVFQSGETPKDPSPQLSPIEYRGPKPIIVGMGPAGIFAALRLVERGIGCVLIERGSAAEQRVLKINRYWRYGELHPDNNVCFGEGGAGLYSDGKLITRIKSPHIPYVLDRLIRFGAPEEIRYLSNPHVGSDRLRRVIPKIRQFLLEAGVDLKLDTRVSELLIQGNRVMGVKTQHGEEIRADQVVLATGHSAQDIFEMLARQGVALEGKSFAMGLRIEHPQKLIDKIQFRQSAGHPKLGAANYKLTCHDEKSGIGVYSFCMCPGGYVLSSGTEPDGVVSNGMSNFNRNSPFANAAVVVSVPQGSWSTEDVLGGLHLRRRLEKRAFESVQSAGGTKELPAQKVQDFLNGKKGEVLKSSSPSGVVATRLDELLPQNITQKLRQGLQDFDRKMPGFLSPDAQLIGVETRTSCPVRVPRQDETLESVSHAGLYPSGEGAGYAGGITSAAVDGVRVAEAIVERVSSRSTSKDL